MEVGSAGKKGEEKKREANLGNKQKGTTGILREQMRERRKGELRKQNPMSSLVLRVTTQSGLSVIKVLKKKNLRHLRTVSRDSGRDFYSCSFYAQAPTE